ncbi:unnamed protein product [Arabidopsis arenosa]|uniref:Exonuclease domain-containing protein n=1 Tax=Arabidopsis arenosa TaxID=38785 RepID=A0A8S2AJG7_ARAAE|nr:unnamed protein product [Arabidopsis arenosa]
MKAQRAPDMRSKILYTGSVMQDVLARKDKDELESLIRILSNRGMRGCRGTWEEFVKVYFPTFGRIITCPSFYPREGLLTFLATFRKKEDEQLFLAWKMSRGRHLSHVVVSKEPSDGTHLQRLVRLTHTRDDHPLDYFLPPEDKDWVVTRRWDGKVGSKMVAVCCEMVLCNDGSETVVRVSAVDRYLKVILDEFVKPNKPVSDYRTDVTGLNAQDLESASTLSVADLQEKVGKFLSWNTFMVGHFLNHDLNALKMDHARKIDTSLVFKYDYSDGPSKPPRPSFDNLCKMLKAEESLKLSVQAKSKPFIPAKRSLTEEDKVSSKKQKKEENVNQSQPKSTIPKPLPQTEDLSKAEKKPNPLSQPESSVCNNRKLPPKRSSTTSRASITLRNQFAILSDLD